MRRQELCEVRRCGGHHTADSVSARSRAPTDVWVVNPDSRSPAIKFRQFTWALLRNAVPFSGEFSVRELTDLNAHHLLRVGAHSGRLVLTGPLQNAPLRSEDGIEHIDGERPLVGEPGQRPQILGKAESLQGKPGPQRW